jgi:hypothetical protein
MSIDRSSFPLGKQPATHDRRTLQQQNYTVAAPTPPVGWGWGRGIKDWGMMLNGPNSFGGSIPPDGLGDCSVVAPAHGIQVWTANTGKEVTLPDTDVLTAYEKWCGYVPGDPNTDQGGNMLAVLKDWQKQKYAGHPLDFYAAIHLLNSTAGNSNGIILPQADVMRAIWLFGGAYIGVQLPISAQYQKTWYVPANPGPDDEPGSWGGHAIWLLSYNTHCLTVISWGILQQVTWSWLATYCDEAWACVSADFLKTSGVSPLGLNLVQLRADLKYVTS